MNDDELMKAVKEQQKEYLKKRDKIFVMMFLGISIILTGTLFDDIPPLEKFLSVIGFCICILSIIKYMWFLNGGSQKKATGQAEKSFHRLESRILCMIFVLVPEFLLVSLMVILCSCGYSMEKAFIVSVNFIGAYFAPVIAIYGKRVPDKPKIYFFLIALGFIMFIIAMSMLFLGRS